MASNLVTSHRERCSLATRNALDQHGHDYREAAGAAGNFITEFGTATEFNAFYVYITNTTKGQGPNYVSAIT